MSAFGTKRTFQPRSAMSAFGGKADSPLTCCDVRFWPIADIVQSPLDQCLALRWGRQSEASGIHYPNRQRSGLTGLASEAGAQAAIC